MQKLKRGFGLKKDKVVIEVGCLTSAPKRGRFTVVDTEEGKRYGAVFASYTSLRLLLFLALNTFKDFKIRLKNCGEHIQKVVYETLEFYGLNPEEYIEV